MDKKELKYGERVEFHIGDLIGSGKIVGKALTDLPIIGNTYIIEPDVSIRNDVYDYTHFVASEIHITKEIDAREQIIEIANQLSCDKISIDYAKNIILNLFGVTAGWVLVKDEKPPKDVEILAKDPNGTIHLTTWRWSYDIFSCQSKNESSNEWQWKLV